MIKNRFSQLDSLNTIARLRTFAKQDVVFHSGQKAEHIYKIVQGEVHLFRHNPDGKRVLFYRAFEGDLVAEASLTSHVYHCSAVCIQASTLESYESSQVKAALAKNPELALAWISILSCEVRAQRVNVERLCLKSPIDKVIHFLNTEGDPSGELLLSGTLGELAEIINISRETLYRTLSAMEKQGLLTRTHDKLSLNRKAYD